MTWQNIRVWHPMRSAYPVLNLGQSGPIRVDMSKEPDPRFRDPKPVLGFAPRPQRAAQPDPLLWEGDQA